MTAPMANPFNFSAPPAIPTVTDPMAGPFNFDPLAMLTVTDPVAAPFDVDMAAPFDFDMGAAVDFDAPAMPTVAGPMPHNFDFDDLPAMPETTAPMAPNFAMAPHTFAVEASPAPTFAPAAQRKVIISPEADIEIIRRHARIVMDQIYNGRGVELLTAMDMIEADWDHFIDQSLPSFRDVMYKEIAETLYRRLREHEQGI